MKQFTCLFESINTLPRIGNGLLLKFQSLGINTIIDLLLHIPQKIIACNFKQSLPQTTVNEVSLVAITIQYYKIPQNQTSFKYKQKKHNQPLQVIASDNLNNVVIINFFNYYSVKYIKDILPIGETKIIKGVFQLFNSNYVINHPEVLSNDDENKKDQYERVYPSVTGLTSKRIASLIKSTLTDNDKVIEALNNIQEWLPDLSTNLLFNQKLPSFKEALCNVHLSNNFKLDDKDASLIRLSLDEVYAYQITLAYLRTKNIKSSQSIAINTSFKESSKRLLDNLGFNLTKGQKETLKDIFNDMKQNQQMIRLVEGDVGSGKTVIALFSMLLVVKNNLQTALMAPTESLANQHFINIEKFASLLGFKVGLLTGSTPAKQRKVILNDLKEGNIDIFIGTHAIFQSNIIFKSLSLVVIDEQHKFGVLQRLSLINKGSNPHILLLSATPIPRTIALAFYGDINISKLKEKPQGRKPIITKSISNDKLNQVIIKVKKALLRKEKIFWICPLVEESEVLELTSSITRYEELLKDINQNQLFLLHGKMKPKEKDQILNAFRVAKSGVLVSTTVIEVGIDIKDCNIIIIEHANNFGLAQLHQLRGRVGRNGDQGVCLLIYDNKTSQTAKKRIQIMEQSNDGFYIAEQDFLLRGGGNILGTQQSGLLPFKIAKIESITNAIEPLKEVAMKYIDRLLNDDTFTLNDNTKLFLKIFNHNIESLSYELLFSG